MCKHGSIIHMDLDVRFRDGTLVRKTRQVDLCVGPLVFALNSAGIRTHGACCGHGRNDGEILLEDGRILRVITNGEYV